MLNYVMYLKNRYLSEKAQGIVEYALLVAAIVVIAAAVLLNGQDSLQASLKAIFGNLGSKISSGVGK